MSPARGRPLLVPLALGLVLSTGLAGCGESSDDGASEPDAATVRCRQQWHDLGEEVAGHESLQQPSSLASRWRNVSATLDYYAVSAKSADCGDTLARQRGAIRALEYLSARLQPYDMELQLGVVQEPAQTYAAGPRPPGPSASPGPATKGKKGKQADPEPRPPKPADVAAALRTLTEQAPLATEQQRPGWQQATVVELSDEAAVKKTVKDLKFLSAESKAFAAAAKALKTIRAGVQAETSAG